MIRTVPLLTDRLYLRRFETDDASKAHENWMTDSDVTEFLSWDTHKNMSETRRVINSWVQSYQYGTLDWCITLKGDTDPIGSITAVQDFPEQKYCEIGYCIAKDHWGKGLMSEAIRAVTDYVFSSTDYLWIQARYDLENSASGRCLEKCNYKEVEVLETPIPKRNNEIRPHSIMRINRSDIFKV